MTDSLVVTVDVECDADGSSSWRNSDPLSFLGVHRGLAGILDSILAETGAVATLFVSNVVLDDDGSVAVLRSLSRVELGAHLHGDFIDPGGKSAAGAMPSENQHEYDEETEFAKLEELGRRFQVRFGAAPKVFRAGRWSASARTLRLLSQLGYVADSSVSPHVHWRDSGRSVDYRQAPEQPYRPSSGDLSKPGDLGIWEFPVSIVPHPVLPGRPLWLRPSTTSFAGMKRAVHDLRHRHEGPRTFVLMFHNNELTPGTSPYSRSERRARLVTERLRSFLIWAVEQGIKPETLSESAAARARLEESTGE